MRGHHLAVQLGIGGAIRLPYAAFADLGGDFVRAEAGAGSKGHGATEYMGGRSAGDYSCLTAQCRPMGIASDCASRAREAADARCLPPD